jgi:hypothetical protein
VDIEVLKYQSAIGPYQSMMRSLIQRDMTEERFAAEYVPRYLADETDWPDVLFEVLDRVFAMSESLVVDPRKRTDATFDKSPEELRESVVASLAKLDELLRPS